MNGPLFAMAGPKSATRQLAPVASEVLNKPALQSGPTSSQVCYWVGLLLAAVICGLMVEVQSSSHASSVETVIWWQEIQVTASTWGLQVSGRLCSGAAL